MDRNEPDILHDAGGRIDSLLRGKVPETLESCGYTRETERQFAELVNRLIAAFREIHNFIVPLSQGRLNSGSLQKDNALASPFKELHARLLHLTWQAEQIANGDYDQHVDFMGDFSDAFNTMVAKLAQREQTLMRTQVDLAEKAEQQAAALHEANLDLHTATEDWARTFNAMTDMILILDEDGVILKANRASIEGFDTNADQVIGRRCDEMFVQAPDMAGKCPFRQMLADGKTHSEKVEDIRANRILLVTTSPIYDDDWQLTGAIHIVKDITEQEKAQQAQQRLNDELAQTVVKLTVANHELERIAHIAAHDLKTPARGIATVATWLAEECQGQLNASQTELLRLLKERAERMHLLIDGVREYCDLGKQPSRVEWVDLRTLSRDILAGIEVPDTVGIEIESELSAVHCDVNYLSVALMHLLENAVAHLGRPHGHIRIGCTEQADHWELTVADDGPGIDARHAEKIFEIFQTLDPRSPQARVGLGLALVKKCAFLLGGDVRVESETGRGSMFTLTIPKHKGGLCGCADPACHSAREPLTPACT